MRKTICLTILAFCAIGCAPVIPGSNDPLCRATAKDRADLAAALAATPDEAPVRPGARIIAALDAACN